MAGVMNRFSLRPRRPEAGRVVWLTVCVLLATAGGVRAQSLAVVESSREDAASADKLSELLREPVLRVRPSGATGATGATTRCRSAARRELVLDNAAHVVRLVRCWNGSVLSRTLDPAAAARTAYLSAFIAAELLAIDRELEAVEAQKRATAKPGAAATNGSPPAATAEAKSGAGPATARSNPARPDAPRADAAGGDATRGDARGAARADAARGDTAQRDVSGTARSDAARGEVAGGNVRGAARADAMRSAADVPPGEIARGDARGAARADAARGDAARSDAARGDVAGGNVRGAARADAMRSAADVPPGEIARGDARGAARADAARGDASRADGAGRDAPGVEGGDAGRGDAAVGGARGADPLGGGASDAADAVARTGDTADLDRADVSAADSDRAPARTTAHAAVGLRLGAGAELGLFGAPFELALRPSVALGMSLQPSAASVRWQLGLFVSAFGSAELQRGAQRLELSRSDAQLRCGVLYPVVPERLELGGFGFVRGALTTAQYTGETTASTTQARWGAGAGVEGELTLVAALALYVHVAVDLATSRSDYRVAGRSWLKDPAWLVSAGAGLAWRVTP